MARIACLAVPLFPLAARLRSEPELAGEALAVAAGDGERARVVAATRRARRTGVEPGQTLPQARALCAELAVRARDPECERAAQAALVEAAEGLSPRVEDAGDGVAYADVEGSVERRFADEEELGRELAAAAERAGLAARVGIAAGKLAARVAAETVSFRDGSPAVVVAAGGEAEFLAPLPLGRLAPELALAETLERWGVRSVGELARLPAAEVASRLGPAGERLHAVARGRDPRPLVPRRPPPAFREGLALEWPVVQLEPLLFVGRATLERLCARLEACGLGCARLELELTLEPAGSDARAFDLPAPTREVKTLLTLARLDLEARPPGAPVAGFAFTARPDRPRAAQLTLFGPRALSPDRLATTLARLFALLGPERVGSPRPVDGHRPGAFALVEFAPPPPPPFRAEPPVPAEPGTPSGGHGLMAVRALRPPLPVEVVTEAERPLAVRPLAVEATAGRPELRGRVRVAAGPWRLEEGWWTGEPADRDYWDVELEGGGLYRLYRDRAAGDWFADGIYD